MKQIMGVPQNRPLADFLPTISIKAKDFAAEMTCVNVQTKDLHGEESITQEHVDNNAAVRKMLTERGYTTLLFSGNWCVSFPFIINTSLSLNFTKS